MIWENLLQVYNKVGDSEPAISLFLKQSKAFDTVDHEKVKLYIIRLRDCLKNE